MSVRKIGLEVRSLFGVELLLILAIALLAYSALCGPCMAQPAQASHRHEACCIGDHVNHAANAAGLFPAGTGVVVSVTPWNTGDGYSYQVRCDKTGRVLPVNFKSSELTKIEPAPVVPIAAPVCYGQNCSCQPWTPVRNAVGYVASRFGNGQCGCGCQCGAPCTCQQCNCCCSCCGGIFHRFRR